MAEYHDFNGEESHPNEDELEEGGIFDPDTQRTAPLEPQHSIVSGELPHLESSDSWIAKSRGHSGENVSRPIQGARDRAVARAQRTSYPPLADLNNPLAIRRRFDEQRTGRMWPSATPQSDAEQRLLHALCLAPGHVAAQHLAQMNAQRYVRASLSPHVYHGDKLAMTDIFSIAYFGLGMEFEAICYRAQPYNAHVLASYDPQEPGIGLDDTIFAAPDAPLAWGNTGNHIEPYAWRAAIDASFAARFFTAWAVAHQLTAILHMPLSARFVPVETDPRLEHYPQADGIDRYMLAMLCVSELLAPRWRLEKQIVRSLVEEPLTLEQKQSCAGPRWREALDYYFPASRDPLHRDPVKRMVDNLAGINFCPQSLIAYALDGHRTPLSPQRWGLYLISELAEWIANPNPSAVNRYKQALLTYEHHYGYHKRFGQRQNLQLTLAL